MVLALVFAAVALATGEPKLSIVARTTSRSHLPAGVITPPGSGRQVVRATAAGAAPVEWILLVVAVVGL
ncbi:MAG TPA: hypothetical protein VFA97_00870, partial [Gaiellaceae bacterium]|nr:hypothetical protein [Gaiellaceae bacterium]